MKAAKEFKYWGGGNQTSQGYYAEADLTEFPALETLARQSLETNETVYQFLSYVAIRRCYGQALKEGVISEEQFDQLLAPFVKEKKFEKSLGMTLAGV